MARCSLTCFCSLVMASPAFSKRPSLPFGKAVLDKPDLCVYGRQQRLRKCLFGELYRLALLGKFWASVSRGFRRNSPQPTTQIQKLMGHCRLSPGLIKTRRYPNNFHYGIKKAQASLEEIFWFFHYAVISFMSSLSTCNQIKMSVFQR